MSELTGEFTQEQIDLAQQLMGKAIHENRVITELRSTGLDDAAALRLLDQLRASYISPQQFETVKRMLANGMTDFQVKLNLTMSGVNEKAAMLAIDRAKRLPEVTRGREQPGQPLATEIEQPKPGSGTSLARAIIGA